METVCTGGVTSAGKPVRLYPIPYRYLDGEERFRNYQWITVRMAKDERDPRPESHRIEHGSIKVEDTIPATNDEWGRRAAFMFQDPGWQFPSVEELRAAERKYGTSIGVVMPKEILGVSLHRRSAEEETEFQEKQERLIKQNTAERAQGLLFEEFTVPEIKSLSFVRTRIVVNWRCSGRDCASHSMQILDWGTVELQRKVGDEAALQKVQEICGLNQYALRFFLGNLRLHPTSFTIVGLWYPKRSTGRLFP
jgi:hypothetical protein